MDFRFVRRVLGMTLFFLSVTIWLWGILPSPQEYRNVSLIVDFPGAAPIYEERKLTLVLPKRLRTGDSGTISLILEAKDKTRNSEIAQRFSEATAVDTASNSVGQDVANVMAHSRLEMSGVLAIPQGDLYESLREEKPVVFYWSVSPQYSGFLKGAIWVNLLVVYPEGQMGQEQPERMRTLLTNQQIEIEAVDFMGIWGPTARLAGAFGILLGAVLGLDGVFHLLIQRFSKEVEKPDA